MLPRFSLFWLVKSAYFLLIFGSDLERIVSCSRKTANLESECRDRARMSENDAADSCRRG